MKLRAELPLDREAEGRFTVFDERGAVVFGPMRCRGEADNSGAKAHGNVLEDPAQAFGDHPYGAYRVVACIFGPNPASSYGSFFVKLAPVSGQALEAWINGRRGIGIHGGDLGPQGILRATFGCLRVDNQSLELLAKVLRPELEAKRDVFYEAVPVAP